MSSGPETALIKKPYRKMPYTKEQLEEFKKCADPVTGPLYFLTNFFMVQHPTKGKIQYIPYEYQLRLIDTYHNNRNSISMLPRQCGKTITAAGYLLWYAMFHLDSTVLIAAHKFAGASEIMSRIKFGYESVPDHIRTGILEYNKQSVVFDNGSRIVAQTTTESTGRGLSISVLYVDELAFVKRQHMAREMWTSVSFTLSTGGKAIITSTPNTSDDLFAELWFGANKTEDEFGNTLPGGLGVNGFKAFTCHWSEHPDRDEKWAEAERQKVGPERFAREILLEFVTFEETLITPIKLSTMQGIDPIEKQGQVRWYKKPTKDHIYLVGLDPSIGTGGDPAAIQVVEAGTNIQIAEWTHNKTPIENQVRLLKEIVSFLAMVTENQNNVYYSVENNVVGEAILVAIRAIGEETIPGIFLSEPKRLGNVRKFRKGFNTTNKNKLAACAQLKNLIETDKIKIFSKKLISELRTFISVDNTYRAKVSEHDDLVLAMLLICRMIEVLKNYLPELQNQYSADDMQALMPLPFFMSSY